MEWLKFQIRSIFWMRRKCSKYSLSLSTSLDLLFLGQYGLGEVIVEAQKLETQ